MKNAGKRGFSHMVVILVIKDVWESAFIRVLRL